MEKLNNLMVQLYMKKITSFTEAKMSWKLNNFLFEFSDKTR